MKRESIWKKAGRKGAAIFMALTLTAGLAACGAQTAAEGNNYLCDTAYAAEKADAGDARELWAQDGLWDTNDQVRDISVKLFRKAANSKRSSMVSPTSVIMAMAMAQNGAKGETRKQMETTFGISTRDLNQWIRAWSAVQPGQEGTAAKDKTGSVNIANAFWYNNRAGAFQINKDYRSTIRDDLNAEIRSGDFSPKTVDQINRWCSKNTNGMIKEIMREGELSAEDRAVLINAIAFEDQWASPYKKSQVKKKYFTAENGKKKKTDLMYSMEEIYCHDDLATGFIKPYSSGYRFVAILPKKGVTVKEYMKKLDGARFENFLRSGKEAVVHAALPAFKSEYKTDKLPQIFQSMGMTDLFSPALADLSGMGEASGQGLFLSAIRHKTYIDVNRQGTKAAAVTAGMVKTTALNPEPLREYTVRLNRPFLYAIIDEYTGTPVFMGTMMNA